MASTRVDWGPALRHVVAAATHCRRQAKWLATLLIAAVVALAPPVAQGQITGTVDSSNVGVATEDSVISSALPTTNLESREFNVDSTPQQLMNTSNPADYGGNGALAASAQEYMIFKFDLSTLPAGAQATTTGSFDFSAWFTLNENMPGEELFGAFRIYEITSGDASWQDRYADASGVLNAAPVTFASLNGTFVELTGVTEDDTAPANNQTGNPFGVLYPGQLVSNGGFDGANRVVGIPIDTISRLIAGQSIGLAMGSILPTSIPPEGDYDNDGDNDGADFLVWQRGFGNSVNPGDDPDGNEDGTVDAADLTVWQDAYGSPGTPPAAGTTNFSIHTSESFFNPASSPTLNFDWSAPALSAVPEPAAFGPMLLAVIALTARGADRYWRARVRS